MARRDLKGAAVALVPSQSEKGRLRPLVKELSSYWSMTNPDSEKILTSFFDKQHVH
jgi:hypothetical protein